MSSTSVLQTITAPTTTTVIRYNSKEFKENGSKADLANDFRLWMDMVNPSSEELLSIQKEFNLDINTINLVKQKTKRPQLRILEEHLFSIILDIRYKTLDQLIVDGIYMFVGKDWLITIHSSDINLVGPIKHTFEQKNQKLKELGIDALFYTIINEVIGKYEQLLTSIEITVTDFEQKSLFRNTSKYLLDYLDTIVRQIILIRRHLWYTRAILNLLIHTQEDKNNKDKTKFLHIAYDDINHLIDLLESYRDTINSTRDNVYCKCFPSVK